MKMIIKPEKQIYKFSDIENIDLINEIYLFGKYDKNVYLQYDNDFKIVVKCKTEEDKYFLISEKQQAEEYYNNIRFIKNDNLKDFIKNDILQNITYFISYRDYTTIEIQTVIYYGITEYYWWLGSDKAWITRCITKKDGNTIKSFDTLKKCRNSLIKFLFGE